LKCNKCGSDLKEGASFCTICGARIEVQQQAPAPQPVEPWPPAPQLPVQQPSEPWPPAPQPTVVNITTAQPSKPTVFDDHIYKTQLDTSPTLLTGVRKKAGAGLIIGIIAACLVLFITVIGGIIFIASIFDPPHIADPDITVSPQPGDPIEVVAPDPKEVEEFDIFIDELFEDWVTSDALTMNYFLANPYIMDIERPEATYGEVTTAELIAEARQDTREISERLSSFTYGNLREDQKIIYDILKRSITLYEITEKDDEFFYYTGYIRPLNGIQVQLPILLAEFTFYTAEDIDRYLDLIADTHRYFSDIIEFERERSRRGYFLCEANTDSVIEQIESYLENREDNLLITVFDYKIDTYEGLSFEQRDEYKERNKELVLENVLPAYDSLLDAMNELRGVGAREGGLANLPGGKDYAHALLRLRIGTDRSAEEWQDLIATWIGMVWMELIEGLHGGPGLLDRYLEDDLGQIPDGTPEEYIQKLENHIAADFPQMKPTNLVILEVHESLQEHTSPAFYLAPAVDRFDDNVVYVNPSSINDNVFMFTVLAHESYPGHMYQSVYFLQQSPHPVRIALSNTGYSEGWATYAEMMSYFYTGMDEDEANLLWNFRFFDMLLGAYVDLGVNIMGWGIDFVYELFDELGLNEEAVESIYNRVTGVPLFSMTYTMGYIELLLLKNEAETALRSDFDQKEFHRFFLETGSAPYPILREYMYKWIDEIRAEFKPAA